VAKQTIELAINGDRYQVAIDPWRTLAEVLREDLGLMGTKIGCNQGDCGACTVVIDGRTVCSCLTLAVEADGRATSTIEGVAPTANELHPIQQAFVDHGAVQCGFCTGGMILSARQLLTLEPAADEAQIRRGLSGNLCRCTGYDKIVAAISHVVQSSKNGEHGVDGVDVEGGKS
jgi:carbon-monoxide dehydrogenase small subunit